MIFDWAYAMDILPRFVPALWVTVQATLAGMLIALTLGMVLTLLRRCRLIWVRWPTTALIEFVRSTPLLVQMYFMFYVLPEAGVRMSAFTAGALALGLHYAAYCAEVYRAGLEAVPRGQWDAAAALNLGHWSTLRRIIVPQAVSRVVPALGNYLVAMFKDTPLLSAITVVELLQLAKMIGAESFRYVEALTMVGVLFLILSLGAASLIRALERRMRVAHA
ncbi:MAG: ectoine/hydroxyectoine ABC transporter permease subunit EhuD [Betaproteobacteria bacterium]|nr:MAG: ectoine/hydroxyectoine ABC transporter permease subunit EhuD [Betaproteobacteria bacterium]